MATEATNDKGFLVLSVSEREVLGWGGRAMCDYCEAYSKTGYYIAVMNAWYCPRCYEQWLLRAKRYEADRMVEQRNYERYKKMLNV